MWRDIILEAGLQIISGESPDLKTGAHKPKLAFVISKKVVA